MTTPDTTDLLPAIRARIDAASGGPWEWQLLDGTYWLVSGDGDELARDAGYATRADRALIAAARTDLPLLLDRALAAERLLARLAYGHGGAMVVAPGDAACGECAPGGEMVDAGWRCPFHELRAAYPVIEVPR